MNFEDAFKHLTGNPPLRWQERLFHDHFVKGQIPGVIDLPTGLGKTMVMAIWLIARGVNKDLPRRLIYVVDRRTVVDQATDIAQLLVMRPITKWMHDHFDGQAPTISTLRGQLADNREWSRDPSRPAIIIGTVDLIGSALLFSGYRSSYKRRPLEAGLLGQDALLVLDEAHLSKPFDKLVTSITKFQQDQRAPMKVVRMSATTGGENANRFKLEDSDRSDNIINERFDAKKRLAIEPVVEAKKLNETIANAAIKLATDNTIVGKRIVVFVRSPDDAKTIAGMIRGHEIKSEDTSGKNPKSVKSKPYVDGVEVLTGTMRGLERDELIERPILKRFLDGDIHPSDEPNQQPVFLISTSAGEVGFDLNADHMVCDTAPLDSMIQRLGRVNRRGKGDATIRLILAKDPAEKTDMDKACIAASKRFVDDMDVSPKALAEFKSKLLSDQLNAASTPEPTMVVLTDILLDAWSMTSITERMPGRPEVAPWLRGINEEVPQTSVAWRAELDLFKDDPNPKKAFKVIFTKHRLRAHESLTTNSYRVVDFLKQAIKPKVGRPKLVATRVVVKLAREIVVTTVEELIADNRILYADPTLILPASFGGLDKDMLSHETIASRPEPDTPEAQSLDVADKSGYEPRGDDRPRLRILIKHTDSGWEPSQLPGGEPIPADLNLESSYDTSTLLFKAIEKSDLRVRLVQPVKLDDEGNAVQSLVLLAPIANKSIPEVQTLDQHVGLVETEARRIADELGLSDPFCAALCFAAGWHDEGKKADIWQRFIGGPKNGQPLGKAATTRNPKSLRGYRHEFGSLLRIHHPERHSTPCDLPHDPDARELALHLIATHHGFGRPHFDTPFDRDFKTTQCEAIHTESIRRFARLQRKYGHWHLAWLENLLRCADALASADQDAEDDNAEESNNESGGDT